MTGASGIGSFIDRELHWVVQDPREPLAYALCPPERSVHYYLFEDGFGTEKMVFATSMEQATTLFCAWHLSMFTEGPQQFIAREMNRFTLIGDQAILRDEMEAEIIGVAFKHPHEGWHIRPADWHAQPD